MKIKSRSISLPAKYSYSMLVCLFQMDRKQSHKWSQVSTSTCFQGTARDRSVFETSSEPNIWSSMDKCAFALHRVASLVFLSRKKDFLASCCGSGNQCNSSTGTGFVVEDVDVEDC